ncbi:hypothetical protein PCASD_05295 [Puccinia coronata f. sp. avenae]|uniref:Uncharacterized protein n=1 Tax=Puccinia coronata f. sp. avenae TaxID=200324 RepID=A0A2N5UXZ9_9BASI|nr:hypothetical protein PCASD_05295 [Puccinia coronata f. sp. avenae]
MAVPASIWLSCKGNLTRIASQLACCSALATPLIVKVKLDVADEQILRFWDNLTKANLVTEEAEGEKMEYLNLHQSFVLGKQGLGDRFLVRPIYKELYERIEAGHFTKWIVTGTPGIGKTFFSAYYMWIAARAQKTVVWQPFPSAGSPFYLMTPGAVEGLMANSTELRNALANPQTVYIVDGQAPTSCGAWTLLVTSPQQDHYKHHSKEAN